MDINELIYMRLSSDEKIAGMLARYSEAPAIFCSEVPNDQQPEWQGAQYPRIVYKINMQANPERSSSGMLYISVYTMKDAALCEEISSAVRSRLKDVLMNPSDSAPCCTAWARTESFEIEGSAILGKDMLFDILEFHDQTTMEPDPFTATADFVKKCVPDALIVGIDDMDDVYEPSDSRPALFIRIRGINKDHESYSLIWMNCLMNIHIIAPTVEARNKWTRDIYTKIFRHGEIILRDGCPMLIQNIDSDNQADPLTKGQISMTGLFTITSIRPEQGGNTPLIHPFFN